MSRFDLTRKTKDPQPCSACNQRQFSTEFGEDFTSVNSYMSKGVSINTENNNIRLNYSGLLVNSGAHNIYAVVSYGDNKYWDNIRYYPMYNSGDNRFEATLPISDRSPVNIAFKDDANNWDNNAGRNYSFNVH